MKIALTLLVLILTGCISMFPHTKQFQPTGSIEKQFFNESDPTIFPDDVRADLTKHKGKLVAWTGVITAIKLDEPADQPEYGFWLFTAKHHYYDWLLDYSVQPEKFFLSPKGEGDFVVVVPVRRYSEQDREKAIKAVEKQFAVGDMIVAYGRPDKINGGVVRLNKGFANSVPKRLYSTKYLTYGRVVRRKL